jgi:hypothetical protein
MKAVGRGLPCLVACGIAVALCAAPALASFGFQRNSFEDTFANPDGSLDTQAGSYPFEVITGFKFNTTTGVGGEIAPDQNPKDLEVALPAGLVGDPSATPKCTIAQFETPDGRLAGGLSGASCPADTQVGVAEVESNLTGEVKDLTFGVYNLVAPPGVPAEFGFNPVGLAVVLAANVRTGGDYGVTVISRNTNQLLRIYGVRTTLWGVPADPGHDGLRGECLGLVGGSLGDACPVETAPKPFLRLPTSCPPEALPATVRADSWQNPLQSVELEGVQETTVDHNSGDQPVDMTGCDRLDFSPMVSVTPDTEAAASPTAMSVETALPQNENPSGLAEADLRKAVVTLPAGLSISPSAANGLEGCSEAQIALSSAGAASCPASAKVGAVTIETPLLETPVEGSVYVAQPYANKFDKLLALYLVAEGSGVVVKLAGEVNADPTTGQLTAIFDNNPQLPFSHLRLSFLGGPRAALMTPQACGSYRSTGTFVPWSTDMPTLFSSSFDVKTGCGGVFSPTFTGGTVSNQAGGFGSFGVRLARSDTDQNFGRLGVTLPPGLLGMLSHVTLCGEPQAALGTCPAASQIGHVTVAAGPGPDSVVVPQAGKPEDPVYLTGPYNGAPFGLSIVVPAEAGPFNLGHVVVRSAIDVDPHTAQITIDSAPFPTILQGVPLDVKTVDVTVDRENFVFNPTDCNPLAVDATVVSTQNAVATLSSRFQAADCASLGFSPKFTASTQSLASKSNGAALDVKVGYPKGAYPVGHGQANIASVKVALPKQLPSRLTTIQKACPEAVFAANPAACPAGSNIGTATATTPVLSTPFVGPVYLVSHGGAAFPDIVMILQAQGVTVDLVGNIDIAKGITTSTFASVPDAPLSSFELKLPAGAHSALTSNLPEKAKHSFCGTTLLMPTTIDAQNGARITQNTRIAVAGCPKIHKKASAAKARRK